MKGLKRLTGRERQAKFRSNLNKKTGKRLSVTIGPEAVAALEVIRVELEVRKKPHTKRAAIETALIEYVDTLDYIYRHP